MGTTNLVIHEFWIFLKFFVQNRNVCPKSKFLSKIDFFVKNWNFCPKQNFFVWNWNFGPKLKCFPKLKVMSKIVFFVKKWIFCEKMKFLSKTEIFVQNWNFCLKLKLLSKIEVVVQNWNFCPKLKLLSKIEVFVQNWNFFHNRNFCPKFLNKKLKFIRKIKILSRNVFLQNEKITCKFRWKNQNLEIIRYFIQHGVFPWKFSWPKNLKFSSLLKITKKIFKFHFCNFKICFRQIVFFIGTYLIIRFFFENLLILCFHLKIRKIK